MTRQFKKLAHLLYECKYHVVFCPKYRYRWQEDREKRAELAQRRLFE